MGKGIFNKDDELIGFMELKVEHESNGREGLASRSWNSLSLTYHTRLNNYTIMGFEGWFPFAYNRTTAIYTKKFWEAIEIGDFLRKSLAKQF